MTTTNTVVATLDGPGLRFLVRTGSGHDVIVDDGRGDAGARPVELLIAAQATCTAMDIITILRKQRQPVAHYEVRVSGDQRDEPPPNVFERMTVLHVVDGEVDTAALRRAIELSALKYCSVSANLAAGVTEVHHAFQLRRAESETSGEVIVTGPLEDPDRPGVHGSYPPRS